MMQKHAAFNEGTKRIGSETDLISLIQTMRLSKFLSKITFERHQRHLVRSFKPYCLQKDDLQIVDKTDKWYRMQAYENIFKLLKYFDPN